MRGLKTGAHDQKMDTVLTVSLLFYLLLGCQHMGVVPQQNLNLRLKPMVGASVQRGHYQISRKTFGTEHSVPFEDFQILSFDLEIRQLAMKDRDDIQLLIKTLSKTGDLSLHSLGFPEKDESLSWTLTDTGEVLDFEGQKTDSHFSVPYLPLPPHRDIPIGQTWESGMVWFSGWSQPTNPAIRPGLGVGIGMILNSVVERVTNAHLAWVRVSGNFGVDPELELGRSGRIEGNYVFDMEVGRLIASRFMTLEIKLHSGGRMEERGCLTLNSSSEVSLVCQEDWEDFYDE